MTIRSAGHAARPISALISHKGSFVQMLLSVLLAVFMTGPARAGSEPAAHIQQEISQVRLAGEGALRWFGLKIYDAQLWVGSKGFQAAAPYANKFALDLRYARKLDGQKIAQASVDEMEKMQIGTPQQREAWRLRMASIFPNVEDGSRITGIHLPNEGSRFYLNGKLLGEIMDEQFARAFFAIWLDPRTTDEKLRNALLANAAPP